MEIEHQSSYDNELFVFRVLLENKVLEGFRVLALKARQDLRVAQALLVHRVHQDPFSVSLVVIRQVFYLFQYDIVQMIQGEGLTMIPSAITFHLIPE